MTDTRRVPSGMILLSLLALTIQLLAYDFFSIFALHKQGRNSIRWVYSQDLWLCWPESWVYAFPIVADLTSPSRDSILDIFMSCTPYLLLSYVLITKPLFYNILIWVDPDTFIGDQAVIHFTFLVFCKSILSTRDQFACL